MGRKNFKYAKKKQICYSGIANHRELSIEKNSSIFDHCQLANVKLYLNSTSY